jgi:hypothetical protein
MRDELYPTGPKLRKTETTRRRGYHGFPIGRLSSGTAIGFSGTLAFVAGESEDGGLTCNISFALDENRIFPGELISNHTFHFRFTIWSDALHQNILYSTTPQILN